MTIYFSCKINEILFQRNKSHYSLADFKKSHDKVTNSVLEDKSADSISLIYYPYQRFPIPHAELEIEGRCYGFFWCCRTSTNLSYKIKNSEIIPLRVRPFVRMEISTSPKQLKKLKNKITKPSFNITCMKAISDALYQNADFNIPFPLSVSPTLSVGYICAKKAFGSSRITSINSYPSLSSLSIHHQAGIYAYSCLSIATEIFLLYAIPKIAFEKSHLIHAIRLWAVGHFS